MKIKETKKMVRCDVCGTKTECDSDDRGSAFRGHKMIVVSVYDAKFTDGKRPDDHRRYYDICSTVCLAMFASGKPPF